MPSKKKEFADKQTQVNFPPLRPLRTEPTFLTTKLVGITMEDAVRLANKSKEWYEQTLQNTMTWVSREMRRVRAWWLTTLKNRDKLQKKLFKEVYCEVTDYHLAWEHGEQEKDRKAGCHFHLDSR